MKRKILVAVLCAMFWMAGVLNAQAPYKHSIGATLGSMQAVSYKTFVTDHFAIQVDLGTKILCTDAVNQGQSHKWTGWNFWNLELNPNFLYEGNLVSGLYGFAGGGVSLGYSWVFWKPNFIGFDYWEKGKFGINAMLGLEYKLDIPLTLQFDFRPGYGLFFNDVQYYLHHFDWSVNVGVRYTF